jgi:hypothetical protein
MSAFRNTPEVFLADKIATLAALENPDWMETYPRKYNTKSQWLCDLLDERERVDGYQYNLSFQRWLEKEYGIGPYDENGSPLSILIYNAQSYRRNDAIRREGFAPLTQAMIDEAHAAKKGIELQGENMLGSTVRNVYKTRAIQGINYLVPPRTRNKCIRPNGQAARIVSF